jgi:hypothetical protein
VEAEAKLQSSSAEKEKVQRENETLIALLE